MAIKLSVLNVGKYENPLTAVSLAGEIPTEIETQSQADASLTCPLT